MKCIAVAVMLSWACLALPATAQTVATRAEKTFGYGGELQHRFTINLSRQNKVIVQVSSVTVLPEVMNLDSIITAALNDIVSLKDSLETTLDNKTVDFVKDTTGEKKFRIVTHAARNANYAIRNTEVYALKMEQDTFRIIQLQNKITREWFSPPVTETTARWSITVVMNYFADIRQYINGTLNNAMKDIAKGEFTENYWVKRRDKRFNLDANYYPMDPGKKPPVVNGTYGQDVLTLPTIRAGFQNVGNTFGTSFSLGASLRLDRGKKIRVWSLMGELLYVYSREPKINLKGNLSRFITLETYSMQKNTSRNNVQLIDHFSFSYLVKQQGDVFNKNTFRLGLPGVQFKFLRLTPELYFNNFFKNVSPGIKLSLVFD